MKAPLPFVDMNHFPLHVLKSMSTLVESGYDTYLVGGAVRDYFMGLKSKDFDLATEACPEEVLRLFSRYPCVTTGIIHGTVAVHIDGFIIEVTSFRKEQSYTDGRHPDEVIFAATLEEDLSRRDFTINALAVDIDGKVYDYFNGINDIKMRVVRSVGNPDVRISEDYLRLLRALRFASVLRFSVEKSLDKALHKHRECLSLISTFRVWSEFIRMLCGENVKLILIEYSDIFSVIIPQISKMIGLNPCYPMHSHDLWTHTAHVVGNVHASPELRLAALFHDFGKPDAFSLDNDGLGHFYGYEHVSAIIAEAQLNRLGCPKKITQAVIQLIKRHGEPIDCDEKMIIKTLTRLEPNIFFKLIHLQKADAMAQSKLPLERIERLENVKVLARDILLRAPCLSLRDLKVNGYDLIEMGIKEGPEIGDWLHMLLDKVAAGKIDNDRVALLNCVKKQAKINNA